MRLTAAPILFFATFLYSDGVVVNALDLRGQPTDNESETDNSDLNTNLSKLRRHPSNGVGNDVAAQRKKKPKPSKPSGKNDIDPSVDVPETDDLCMRFCNDYFETCSANNQFLEDFDSEESALKRMTDSKSLYPNYFDECGRVCMLWPRPKDPLSFATQRNQGAAPVNSNTAGDTFWCRQNHLSLITNANEAAFHCPHASAGGYGICRDSLVDGYTPYEWFRAGEGSEENLNNCVLRGERSVAQCEDAQVNDDNLPTVLQSLPSSTKIIFLSGNVGINNLRDNVFRDNLKDPAKIEALYLNDCEINTIGGNALAGLSNLKIFMAGVNFVSVLPNTLLKPTPKLLQFEMFANRIATIPQNFFSYTPDLERIAMYGNPAIDGFEPGTFDGLTKLKLFTFAACRIYSFNIPNNLFKDLKNLQFLDLFSNRLAEFRAAWFDGEWESNLLRLAFQDNPQMVVVGNGAFDSMTSLETVYFDGTRVGDRAGEFFDGTKPCFERITVP